MQKKHDVILRLSLGQARAMSHALRPNTLKAPAQRRAAEQAGERLEAAIKRRGRQGHPRVIDRAAVKRLAKRGMSHQAIADELGISKSGARLIRRELGC
jgi:hypothetical protein